MSQTISETLLSLAICGKFYELHENANRQCIYLHIYINFENEEMLAACRRQHLFKL